MVLFTYVGSKSRHKDFILSKVPKDIKIFIDPFMGSCVIPFELWKRNHETEFYLFDNNKNLYHFYKKLIEDKNFASTLPLFYQMAVQGKSASELKSDYYKYRHAFNSGIYAVDSRQKNMLFYFLMKLCWRGLWRVRKTPDHNGIYRMNTPFGYYKRSALLRKDYVQNIYFPFIKFLSGVTLGYADFHGSLEMIHRQNIVDSPQNDKSTKALYFFDPPYVDAYDYSGFDIEEQALLMGWVDKISVTNKFLYFNYDEPLILEWAKHNGYSVAYLSNVQSIHQGKSNQKHQNKSEIMVSNF